MRRCVLFVCIVLGTLLPSGPRLSAQSQTTSDRPGKGLNALPGVYEVPFGVRAPKGFAARAGLNYGWTESVLKANDNHHRFQLDAAASFTPRPWLSSSLRLLGRYDLHTGGANNSDYGVVTETHLTTRTSFPVGPYFHLGSQLELWLPGGNSVGKSLTALSGDAQLLLTYAPSHSPLSIGLALGLRLDRSRYAGGQPQLYSAADRLALGTSDGLWAAHPGLAVSYRVGKLEWVAEWAWRMYFAYVARSPMWIRAGARYHPSARTQLELLFGVSPSRRPSLAQGAPLVVVEPRLWAGLAATYAWPEPDRPTLGAPTETPERANDQTPGEATQRANLRGQVIAPGGAGLPGASVVLSRGEETIESTTTDNQGQFAFTALAAGTYEVVVQANDFKPDRRSFVVHSGEVRELVVPLARALPIGQIRGTVRRFNGQPVVAVIRLQALHLEQQTRDDGTFEMEVPPGDYTVSVTAPGFQHQTRTAHVEQRGVAILIIELEPTR